MPISVFCGCCPEDTLRSLAQDNNPDWPWILDTSNSIVGDYEEYINQYGYPTLVFIDKSLTVREVTGYQGLSELSAKIDEVLQGAGS